MSLLGKLTRGIKEQFARVENEEELDAVVAASVLIAAAEGGISEDERATAIHAMESHEALKGFRPETIRAKFSSDANLINSDKELATGLLEGKVKKGLKSTEARIRAIGIAKQIANADGVFSKEEEAVVDKIRRITA